MYKKGHEKKEEIYVNAKKLLYENGYTNTTIKKIAEISDTPISLIHYYFNKKDDLIKCVYKDYLDTIQALLLTTTPQIFSNTILSHAVLSRIYYDVILNDPNNRRVYYEVLLRHSNYGILQQHIINIYKRYVGENQIEISDELFMAYVYLDFGARREFFTNYLEGKINLSVQELVSSVNGLLPRLLKIDQKHIDEILLESLTIFNSLDYRGVKFLI